MDYYDLGCPRDVPLMRALRSILGWRTTAWWRNWASCGMAWDPTNVTRCKHKVGLHNRDIQWDTPMARWAGEGHGWIKIMAQRQPRKEDVLFTVYSSPGDKPWKRRPKQMRPGWQRNRGNCLSSSLKHRRKEKTNPGDQGGLCKTIVDWVNGHAKLKTREDYRELSAGRVDLRQRIADWETHIFREHDNKADLCAVKGVQGLPMLYGHRPLWIFGWQLRQ